MSALKAFLNSPVGPKTTHFWGPVANWGFVIAVSLKCYFFGTISFWWWCMSIELVSIINNDPSWPSGYYFFRGQLMNWSHIILNSYAYSKYDHAPTSYAFQRGVESDFTICEEC